MADDLSYWEMSYLSQMIYRINSKIAGDFQSVADIILSQLKELIPYRKAIMAEISSSEKGVVFSHVSSIPPTFRVDLNQISLLEKPVWWGYLEAPWSTVFIASSMCKDEEWLNSSIYREVYQPENLFYALHGIFIHHDCKLGMLTLLRSREDGDFTERELWYMELLKPHIELHLFREKTHFQGLQMETDSLYPSFSITRHYIDKYHLTHREVAVVNPILGGAKDSEICSFLGITQSTLDKHIHNVYRKTGATSRASLFQCFRN